jgi:hypothetical protein
MTTRIWVNQAGAFNVLDVRRQTGMRSSAQQIFEWLYFMAAAAAPLVAVAPAYAEAIDGSRIIVMAGLQERAWL